MEACNLLNAEAIVLCEALGVVAFLFRLKTAELKWWLSTSTS